MTVAVAVGSVDGEGEASAGDAGSGEGDEAGELGSELVMVRVPVRAPWRWG